MNNEQPLMADLHSLPTSTDACLLCTNLRTMSGKKPTFTDAIASWFLIPLSVVRFVEMPLASVDDSAAGRLALPSGDEPMDEEPMEEPMDVDSGNELLRRMREV